MEQIQNTTQDEMRRWKVQSPETSGWHTVIAPGSSSSKVSYVFRLNLEVGEQYEITTGDLEMHPVLMSGKAKLSGNDALPDEMTRYDSFYLPARNKVLVTAIERCIFYVGGARYEGIGETSFRKYDPNLPLGDIHQVHGHGAGRREVMFTLDPGTPASNLICGLSWSSDGAWTSWPPHQHEKDLEEVYCYFDMDEPHFGFHLSYLESGKIENCVTHVVRSGTMVQAPKGYHPTVSSPGSVNAYLWILVAFTPKSRRYDLAIPDPAYIP